LEKQIFKSKKCYKKEMNICGALLKSITAKSLEIRLQALPIFHWIYIHELDKSTIR